MVRESQMMQCAVCMAPGSQFNHFDEEGPIAVAESLGFAALDNFCDMCYRVILDRTRNILKQNPGNDSSSRTPTLETLDVSLPRTESSSLQELRRVTRLSEMPLPESPRGGRSSSSNPTQSSGESLDDTVDRRVKQRPRVSKETIERALASQSLSVEDLSSQGLGVSRKRSQSSLQVPAAAMSQSIGEEDSSEEQQLVVNLPPKPKKPRMRPTVKQFATGQLDLPMSVRSKILSDDMPRMLAG